MKNLQKFLKDYSISNSDIFYEKLNEQFFNSNYLSIASSQELKISYDDKILDKKIQLCKKIIHHDDLEFRGQREIDFEDCIFTGKIKIINLEENCKIKFYNCIFLESVSISLNSGDNSGKLIELTNVNCKFLILLAIKCNFVKIFNSQIGRFHLYNNDIDNFFVVNNNITHLDTISNFIKNIDFDYCQINKTFIKSHIDESVLNENINNINWFEFINGSFCERVSTKDNIENIKFLLEYTNVRSNRDELSNLIYHQTLCTNKKLSVFFLKILGGFVKPKLIIIYITLVNIIFSAIYSNSYLKFKKSETIICGLSFGDAIYFSGLTFSTIGYGDITPCNFSKYFSIAEGFAGIFLTSVLIVSLVRKYAD